MIKAIYTSSLVLALSLQGCLPTHNTDVPGANAQGINIVVTQGTAENAESAVAALRKSLTDAATANRGHLPALELRVLRSSGELIQIHASVTKSWGEMIFGDTPAARQKKLAAVLAALEKEATGKEATRAIAAQTLKLAPHSAFKTPGLTVWAVGGANNPWATGEPGAEVVVSEDEAAFVQRLTAQASRGGNFLVITDGGLAKPLPAVVSAERESAESPTPAPAPAGTPNTVAKAENVYPSPALVTTAVTAPRAADNIIIQMEPGKAGDPDAKVATVMLPPGAELIGEVLFDFNTDKLDSKALAEVKRDAMIIKSRGATRVILIASADYVGSTVASDKFATKRGMVVEAALMMEGVPVERRIEVGARLSVKGASVEDRAKARGVRIYAMSEKSAKIASNQDGKH